MGAFVHCWRCDKPFRATRRNARLCSPECRHEWLIAGWQRRVCLICHKPIGPERRIDARCCSAKCRQRGHRLIAGELHFRSVQVEVADDFRQLDEAWRRARRQDPDNYPHTPVADKFREEQRRIQALFERREFRPCEQCGEKAKMRSGQVYCSSRCRVAAHRARHR